MQIMAAARSLERTQSGDSNLRSKLANLLLKIVNRRAQTNSIHNSFIFSRFLLRDG